MNRQDRLQEILNMQVHAIQLDLRYQQALKTEQELKSQAQEAEYKVQDMWKQFRLDLMDEVRKEEK